MARNDISWDDQPEQGAEQQGQADKKVQQRPKRVIEEGVRTLYSAFFNIAFGRDAVFFIFGNQAADPNAVRIESKVAVSLKTAKRIALLLSDLIRRYEAVNGMIDISIPQQPMQAAGAKSKPNTPVFGNEGKKPH